MSSIPDVSIQGGQEANGNVTLFSATLGTGANDLWRTAPLQAAFCDLAAFHHFVDDFQHYDGTNDFALVKDGAGGILILGTDVDDNDEAYVSSIAEIFKFAANKPLWFEASVALIESAVNKLNMIIGLSDTVGANSLLDNGAGPMASYDGAVFFKVDGGTVWQFETSDAGTQVTNSNVAARVSGAAIRLGFIFDPNDGDTGKITPYINGVAGTTHDIALSGLEEMHILFGIKNGSAAPETSIIDYVRVLQVR